MRSQWPPTDRIKCSAAADANNDVALDQILLASLLFYAPGIERSKARSLKLSPRGQYLGLLSLPKSPAVDVSQNRHVLNYPFFEAEQGFVPLTLRGQIVLQGDDHRARGRLEGRFFDRL